MAKHRLTPSLFFKGKPYRPTPRRKPAGLSGYLPMHSAPSGYSSTIRASTWGGRNR